MGPYRASSKKQCIKICPEDKENVKIAVLKVVRIKSRSRTSESLRYWVAVAAGNYDGMIGLADFFSTNEKRATKGAEKKAMKRLRRINRLEDRTVPRRVFGRAGGDCVSLSEAPKDVRIVGSGMTRKLLNMAGITDCFVTNSSDTITCVRALEHALSKLSYH